MFFPYQKSSILYPSIRHRNYLRGTSSLESEVSGELILNLLTTRKQSVLPELFKLFCSEHHTLGLMLSDTFN